MLRFCLNISILLTEVPFLDRFTKARELGFTAVEMWWPGSADPDDLVKAVRDAGVEVVAMNFDAGDMAAGDRGLVSDPDRVASFREGVSGALELGSRLDCRKMNALLGHQRADLRRADQLALARDTVAWTADRARRAGVTVLVEPINTIENGPYLLKTTVAAASFVRSVGRDNVGLQYDVYHMQRMEGNLTSNLREYMPDIRHIQIADSPDRGEPGTGEISFPYLFREIERAGYDGFIGLEYRASGGDTARSLGWLPEKARSGAVRANELISEKKETGPNV